MQRSRVKVVSAVHLIRSFSDAATKAAASDRFNFFLTRTNPHLVAYGLFPHLSAAHAYINRFRGAPSHEVPRNVSRRHPSDKNPVTFGSAVMESLLHMSAMFQSHPDAAKPIAVVSDTAKPTPEVRQTSTALHKDNMVTERSKALHAAAQERMVQTNQPYIFECVQYHHANLVRYPRSLYVFLSLIHISEPTRPY